MEGVTNFTQKQETRKSSWAQTHDQGSMRTCVHIHYLSHSIK